MTTHQLFAVHMLQPFHVFSNILDLIRAENSIYENVQYFIWSKNNGFKLLQLDILSTRAVKRCCD